MRTNHEIYTVKGINCKIKESFDRDIRWRNIFVKGEISQCKYDGDKGHIYFTLKDSEQDGTARRVNRSATPYTLSCIMWASNAALGLQFHLETGQQVLVGGSISSYDHDGKCQLYAKQITLDGVGALYLQNERLKRELEELGMFSDEYKKPIPEYIKTLGVVTSDTGAAIRDIIQVASRRNPYVQIILCPSVVQGENAVAGIVRGIRALEQMQVDVMIVGRGGGPSEDLEAFNAREVAQAVFDCSVPIISAVGHKINTPIIDYVADRRAATPSEAAELAVKEVSEIFEAFSDYETRLNRNMQQRINGYRNNAERFDMKLKLYGPADQIKERRNLSVRLEEQLQIRMERVLKNKLGAAERLAVRFGQHSPSKLIEDRKKSYSHYEEQLDMYMQKILVKKRHNMELYIAKMKGLSPLDKLQSGFSYVEDDNGHNVHSIEGIAAGQNLRIRVQDGNIQTKVISVQEEGR